MWKTVLFAAAICLSLCMPSLAASPMLGFPFRPTSVSARRSHFNQAGNVVIADQFNNRIVEVNLHHQIVWSFGSGNPHLCNPGPGSIIGPNDEEPVGAFELMAGTGVPPNTIPEMPAGCVDNRVIAVNEAGQIVWQYGKAGVTGAGFNQLNVPVCDVFLPNDDVLITDQSNERVIEVTLQKNIVWQYGMTGIIGDEANQLNNPNCAELLSNGHILISDENNNRVIEVTRSKKIVWQYGTPDSTSILNGAAFASRLPNGDTLITDSGNARILEVTPDKRVIWTYHTNARRGSIMSPLPTRAVRLESGLTLISDQFNQQVIAVERDGEILFSQGVIGDPGNGFNDLYAPYDAKIIGDYTGLTPP